jgi:hypothetical protein
MISWESITIAGSEAKLDLDKFVGVAHGSSKDCACVLNRFKGVKKPPPRMNMKSKLKVTDFFFMVIKPPS